MIEQYKKEIASAARRLDRLGMINQFEGNISVRYENSMLITPSQQDKESMDASQIIRIGSDGKPFEETGYKPSSEWKMHAAAYRIRPDVGAVIHHHACYATSFAMAGKELCVDNIPEALLLLGNIPVTSYGRPGTEDIFCEFEEYLVHQKKDVLLLGNHGVIALGKDLKEAMARAIEVEKIAKLIMLTNQNGGFCSLPEGETAILTGYRNMLWDQAHPDLADK